MRNWIARLRQLAGRDDRADAYAAEASAVQRALDLPAVEPRVATHHRALVARGEPETVHLGNALADPTQPIALSLSELAGSTHALVLGASGGGKSRLLAALCRQVVRAHLAGRQIGLVLLDPKSELAQLILELIAVDVARVGPEARRRLLADFAYVDPFADHVPLNVLARIPGVAPEVQAFDVATALEHVGGEGAGPLQRDFLYNIVLAGIGRATLPRLYELTGDARALATFAAASEHADVRGFFASQRIGARSIEGLRARLHALLRVPAARRCLEAETCLPFHEITRGCRVTLFATGDPPLGTEDVARMFNILFLSRLGRGVFARPGEIATPMIIVCDEFQTGAAGQAVDTFERLLNLARSRRVGVVLATQSLSAVGRVSPNLATVVATNAAVLAAFRAGPEDARLLADALPVTRRRARHAEPWEEHSVLMTESEERRLLLSEACALGTRTFYFLDRRQTSMAILTRTVDVERPMSNGAAVEALRRGRRPLTGRVASAPQGVFRVAPRGLGPRRGAPPARPTAQRRPRRT